MNLYLHPIILLDRGLLSSAVARAFLVSAYVFLFWFNFRYPPPVSIERPTPNLEYLVETERAARACPPLPLHTAAKIELITRTVTGKNHDFDSLWNACDGDPDLETIVLEQWIMSNPGAAMKKAKGTHLDLLSWQLLGEQEGTVAWTKHRLLKKEQRESLLAGIARSDPEFVIRLVEQNRRLESDKIFSQTLDGLAQNNVKEALNYHLNTLSNYSDWFESFGSFDYYQKLMHWSRESPEEASSWVWENKNRPHKVVSFLTREIARTDPQLVLDMIDRLPTGRTKKIFQQEIEDAEESNLSNEDNPRGVGSNRSPDRLLLALQEASNSFSGKWPELLRGTRFNDLPGERKNLVRSVVKERWIDYNPMGYAEENGYSDPECAARWLELDEPGLFRKLKFLIRQKDQRAHGFFPAILEAVGRKSMPRAFDLFDQYPSMVENKTPSDFDKVMGTFAARDRDAFLAAAPICGPWGTEAQSIVIAACLEKDLPWCLEKCHEWNREDLILGLDEWQLRKLPIIQHFDKLPPDWRDKLIGSEKIASALDLEWLLQPPPSNIDKKSLKKIRTGIITWKYWFPPEAFPVATEVIKRCQFLDPKLRSKLAGRIVASHDDFEEGKKWLSEIPEEFRKEAQLSLERLKTRVLLKTDPSMEKPFILEALDLPLGRHRFLERRIRPTSDYDEILTRVRQIPAEDCVEFIKTENYQMLLVEIQKALLENALRIHSNRDNPAINTAAQRMTIQWAEDEPVLAARWALALPRGEVRDRCLLKAYIHWTSWDRQEAESWGRTLSTEDRKILSLR